MLFGRFAAVNSSTALPRDSLVCARSVFFIPSIHQDRLVLVVGGLLALFRVVGLRDSHMVLRTFPRDRGAECEHEPVCVDAPSAFPSTVKSKEKEGEMENP